MTDAEYLASVKAAAALLCLPMSDDRAQRVAAQLGRISLLAQQLEDAPLTNEDAPAESFCPAPFPSQPDSGIAP